MIITPRSLLSSNHFAKQLTESTTIEVMQKINIFYTLSLKYMKINCVSTLADSVIWIRSFYCVYSILPVRLNHTQ